MKDSIFSFTKNALADYLHKEHHQPRYRAGQIFEWLYQKRVSSFDEMTNLSDSLRTILKETFSFERTVCIAQKISADQAAIKFLWEQSDKTRIESVLIKEKTRATLCLSTQVGCKFGCMVCASGKHGFVRNLTAGEIIAQVREVCIQTGLQRPTNIVYMGMGEPFDNYANVISSVRILNDPQGLGIGARRMTISTCGLVPGIQQLPLENIQVELAVSLHAALDSKREQMLPINKKYPLKMLIETCRQYTQATKRLITFEYVLVKGFNDTREDLDAIVKLLSPFPCKVNLIPYNPITSLSFKPPSLEETHAFAEALTGKGIHTTIRFSKGSDIAGACGQLAIGY